MRITHSETRTTHYIEVSVENDLAGARTWEHFVTIGKYFPPNIGRSVAMVDYTPFLKDFDLKLPVEVFETIRDNDLVVFYLVP